MAHELSSDDMRRLARLGAMRRLDDIRAEEAAIRKAFPELFSGARPAARVTKGAPAPATAAKPAKTAKAAKGKARKRSTMSPAMRKVVSERMKKYWAGRRKAKNG